jgi:hypothetical protein
VIDVGDDGEIAGQFGGHGSWARMDGTKRAGMQQKIAS